MAEESISGYTNNSDGQQRSAEKSKFDNFENLIKMSDLQSSAKRKDKTSSIVTCSIDLYAKQNRSGFDDELDVDETDERTGFGD